MNMTEFAVAAVNPIALDWIGASRPEREAHWTRVHCDPELASWLAGLTPTHLYFGSEFCEHLLPSGGVLQRVLRFAEGRALKFALLTPVASPDVLRRLETLLPLLPPGAEVIVNDWGVGRLVAERFPDLRAVAGRILCRMVKDPRLAATEWSGQCGLNLDSAPLQAVLRRIGIRRFEIDMPLFADAATLRSLSLPKGVHLPYFYVAKGRMCRPGAMAVTGTERFAVGRRCRKECLTLAATTARPGRSDNWPTLHVGNALLSRHSPEMSRTLRAAAGEGAIERVIVPGEPL